MSNWQLVITLATFVFAVFGAGWLNNQMLKHYIDARFDTLTSEIRRLDEKIDNLGKRLDARIEQVDKRIDQVQERLARIERQLEAIFKPSLPR